MGVITSMSNNEKTHWFRIKASDDVVASLHNVIMKLDDSRVGFMRPDKEEGFHLACYDKLVGTDHDPFVDESLLIVFCKKEVKVILMKDSPNYESLKKYLLENFGLLKVKSKL